MEQQIPKLLEVLANANHIVRFLADNDAPLHQYPYTNNSVEDFADEVGECSTSSLCCSTSVSVVVLVVLTQLEHLETSVQCENAAEAVESAATDSDLRRDVAFHLITGGSGSGWQLLLRFVPIM